MGNKAPARSPDVTVVNHFTIFAFQLNTPAAKDWVDENVVGEIQYFGDALMVEHRFARDVAAGMTASGLVVR